jgi:hypothetical protein
VWDESGKGQGREKEREREPERNRNVPRRLRRGRITSPPGSERRDDVAACQDELATEGDTSARIDTRTSGFSRFAS